MSDFSDLNKRTKTAALLIGLLVILEICYWLVPFIRRIYGFIPLLLVFLCSHEITQFSAKENDRKKLFIHLTALTAAALYLFHKSVLDISYLQGIQYLYLPFYLALLSVICSGYRVLEVAQMLAAEIFVTAFLVGSGGVALAMLATDNNHFSLYWIIAVVIANDIGAYFWGKFYGVEKLAPCISPGKTVAGSIGGLLAGALTGFLLFPLSLAFGWSSSVFAALYVGFCSQLGDLAKSYLKRLYAVKNTGSLLPGHGGVLDRLDGVLAGSVGYLFIRQLLQ